MLAGSGGKTRGGAGHPHRCEHDHCVFAACRPRAAYGDAQLPDLRHHRDGVLPRHANHTLP